MKVIRAMHVKSTPFMNVYQELREPGDKYGTLGQFYVNKVWSNVPGENGAAPMIEVTLKRLSVQVTG